MNEPVSAIGYVRTDPTEETATATEQIVELEMAADRRSWRLEVVCDEGRALDACNSTRRPALADALDRLNQSASASQSPPGMGVGQVGVLVVTSVDRLCWSMLDFAELGARARSEGWAIVVLGGEFPFDMTKKNGLVLADAFGQFSHAARELHRGQVTAGRAEKARRGEGWVAGPPPYGYRCDSGVLVPVPEQVKVVRFIFRKGEKRMMRAKIARILNDEGVPAPRGGKWRPERIRRMLANPVYAGRYESHGQVMSVPAIVPLSQWRRAQRGSVASPPGKGHRPVPAIFDVPALAPPPPPPSRDVHPPAPRWEQRRG